MELIAVPTSTYNVVENFKHDSSVVFAAGDVVTIGANGQLEAVADLETATTVLGVATPPQNNAEDGGLTFTSVILRGECLVPSATLGATGVTGAILGNKIRVLQTGLKGVNSLSGAQIDATKIYIGE